MLCVGRWKASRILLLTISIANIRDTRAMFDDVFEDDDGSIDHERYVEPLLSFIPVNIICLHNFVI